MVEIAPASRRSFLARSAAAAAAAVASLLPAVLGHATPQAMQEALGKIAGARPVRPGKVKLDIPPLVENGNVVPLTVSVDSPMTQADHVMAIHILNEKNPQPHVISVMLGPRAGRASLQARIKLADSQRVLAVAEMSDGSLWSGAADVVVALAACVEDIVR